MITVTLPGDITLSPTTVLALAATHIGHYSHYIEVGGPHVCIADCLTYKALWCEIRARVTLGQALDGEHLQELHDAVTCGLYDCYLTADEFRAVHREQIMARAS